MFFMFCSSVVGAQEYEIKQFELGNIVVPSDFGVCTLEKCDSAFMKMLKRFNHTYEDWVEQVMKPGDIYFYASDDKDRNVYIKCKDVFANIEGEDKEKYDKYMYDYNLVQNEEDQEKVLQEYKDYLEGNNVGTIDVEVKWNQTDGESATQYIVSSYRQSGLYVYEYNTIYAGIEWTYSISCPSRLTSKERQIVDKLVSQVEYGYDVDYTGSKMAVRFDEEKEETDEENFYLDTKYGRIVFLTTTIIAIIAIICIITDKQMDKYKNK